MTACSSKLQHISYVIESAWGENSTSATSAQTIPTTVMADLSKLGRVMLDAGRIVQYRNERPKMIPGPFEAEFTIEIEAIGHGSTCAGAVTATAAETLLGYALGAVASPTGADGTTISGTASTATSLNVAAASGLLAGQIIRLGAKNDGRGDGQPAVVSSHGTSVIALKTAAPAAMATAADVVYTSINVHTVESTCATQPLRFFIKTADTNWCLHGCFVKALSFTGGSPGQIAKWQYTIGVSWLEPITTTFPDTTTTAAWTTNAVPTAAGSVFMNAYGTATRATLTARSISIGITLGVQPVMGYNGISTAQTIVGASRVPDDIKVSLIVDAEGDSATPTWWTAWAANLRRHLLIAWSVGDGSTLSCYFPNLAWAGKQPTQQDFEGLNRVPLEFVAGTDTAGATDLERSAMRWGLA